MSILKSTALFVLAAIAELGGAYLIWQLQRASKPLLFALLGALGLFVYAFVQTAQTFSFGRVLRPTAAFSSPLPPCGVGGSMGAYPTVGNGSALESACWARQLSCGCPGPDQGNKTACLYKKAENS